MVGWCALKAGPRQIIAGIGPVGSNMPWEGSRAADIVPHPFPTIWEQPNQPNQDFMILSGFRRRCPKPCPHPKAFIRGFQCFLQSRFDNFCQTSCSFHFFCNKYFYFGPFLSSKRMLRTLLKNNRAVRTSCAEFEILDDFRIVGFIITQNIKFLTTSIIFDVGASRPKGAIIFKQCTKHAFRR